MRANEQALKTFLYANLYRHADVMRVRTGADQIVRELFDAYFANPRAMPEGWREGLGPRSGSHQGSQRRRFSRRYDRYYAIKEHQRLFDHTPDLG